MTRCCPPSPQCSSQLSTPSLRYGLQFSGRPVRRCRPYPRPPRGLFPNACAGTRARCGPPRRPPRRPFSRDTYGNACKMPRRCTCSPTRGGGPSKAPCHPKVEAHAFAGRTKPADCHPCRSPRLAGPGAEACRRRRGRENSELRRLGPGANQETQQLYGDGGDGISEEGSHAGRNHHT